jgi:hypothetical protein
VLRDEHEGLLYPPGDDETLAAAILEVLGSTKTSERLTEGGYRRVRDHFSSGARRRRVAAIYAAILPDLRNGDPWVDDFEEEEIGPSESEIEAAEAALRGELPDGGEVEPSTSELEAIEELEPSASEMEQITSDPGLSSDPGLASDPGLSSDAGIGDLASEPTTVLSITDIGIEAPPPHARSDTNPGQNIPGERTRPRA